VAKIGFALVIVALASVLAGAQATQQSLGPRLDFATPLAGSPLTCSPGQTQKLVVPNSIAAQAKLKAHLLNLLRDSLFDDARGIVNTAREKEIKKLASKLKGGKPE
jgi:hypothetical protein